MLRRDVVRLGYSSLVLDDFLDIRNLCKVKSVVYWTNSFWYRLGHPNLVYSAGKRRNGIYLNTRERIVP